MLGCDALDLDALPGVSHGNVMYPHGDHLLRIHRVRQLHSARGVLDYLNLMHAIALNELRQLVIGEVQEGFRLALVRSPISLPYPEALKQRIEESSVHKHEARVV